MKVNKIIKLLKKLQITGISDDTRYLDAGNLFICKKGTKYNGLNFIHEAISKGAKAILTEEDILLDNVVVIKVNSIQKVFYELIAKFYRYPWKKLKLIGVTGTDGKTTTASYIKHLLGNDCAYIGTNGIVYYDKIIKTSYTTLPYCLFVRTLYELQKANIKYVSLEASSQGLINNRLYGINFDVAIFTNLTYEHLDTHKNMYNYFQAKLILFKQLKKNGLAIVNRDSKYSNFIHVQKVTFSIQTNADYQITNIVNKSDYLEFTLLSKNNQPTIYQTNVFESYNLSNLLAAIIVAKHFKVPNETLKEKIIQMPSVAGRLQLVSTDLPFKIYIDFAHTPNALYEVLKNLRSKTNGRIIGVCGSAGEKDKYKRHLIGQVATNNADYVIFTSEDYRSEDPYDIISQMISLVKTNNYEIIIDRKKAIEKAIKIAKENDIVIVTGKGNDEYFETNEGCFKYSDYETIQEIFTSKKI